MIGADIASQARWVRIIACAMVVPVLLAMLTLFATSPRTVSAQTPAATPATCSVGVDILSIHGINLDENTFDVEFWIWSVCKDDQIKPLQTMEFVNANDVTVSLQGETMVDGVYWNYAKVEGTFRYYWDLTDFPFDHHDLQIHIENADWDMSSFVFVPDTAGSAYESDLPLEGWSVDRFGVSSAPYTYKTTYGDPQNPVGTSDYSRFTAHIELERADYNSFFKLTFVVYIAFLISLVSYFVNLKNPAMLAARLGVISGALFTVAVSLRTATDALSSQEGFTLVGKIHLVAMAAILVDAVAALATQLLTERGRSEVELKRFDRNVMILVVIGFVAANIWLITSAAHHG
jgi:hypothetical protein